MQPIVEKLRKFLDGIWSHLGFIKYVLVALVLSALALTVSLIVWSRIRPISEYRSVIQAQLKKVLHADTLQIQGVDWAWHWQTLSIGIEGKDVVYKDDARHLEGAIPALKVMWSPLKIFLGSLSITAQIDESTWQIGGGGSSLAANLNQKPLLRGLTRPNFWQRRRDIHIEGEGLNVSAVIGPGNPVLFSDASLKSSLLGGHSYFDGSADAHISKSSELGSYDGRLELDWSGAFQFVDGALVGISVDHSRVDFSNSKINGWGILKEKEDPLKANFGIQMLVNDEGEFTTVDVKEGKLKFGDLNFAFDGDQKNASGAAFKWILENQQLNKNRLPFQILRQAKVSGPVQAEGRVSISKAWDFSALWSLRANGLNFKAAELKDQFDPHTEGMIVFNLAFDGGYESGMFHSSGFQLKLEGKDALLISKTKAFKKPMGQAAQLQILFDIADNVLTLKPSFFEWSNFRFDANGKIESLSEYLLRDREAPFQMEAHTSRLDISKLAPLLSFLKQNPVPSGILELSGAVSGSFSKKSLLQQFEDRELAWRIDQFSLSDFVAGIDSGALLAKEKDEGYSVDGVFKANLSARARGRGNLVQSSNVQADVNFTDAEIIWANQFRKPKGIAGRLKTSLNSVPNKVEFKSSRLTFLDNDIDFSGTLNQGSPSRIFLSLQKSIDLKQWRGFFRTRDDVFLQGMVRPQLYLSLLTAPDQMDSGIDWRRIGLAGTLSFKDLRGVLGTLSVFDNSSGLVKFSDGRVSLNNVSTSIANQRVTLNGFIKPLGQRGDVSFYDIAAAKEWDANLAVSSDKIDVPTLLRGLRSGVLSKVDGERSKNSLEPRTWLNADEIDGLRSWTLLDRLRLTSTWKARQLQLGPWTLANANGSLSLEDHKFKYTVLSATWKNNSHVSGSGIWEIKPRGSAVNGVSMMGTWKWNHAPLSDLLSMWDLRESKVLRGNFTGAWTYSVEKFSSSEDEKNDRIKINLDGSVKDAQYMPLKFLETEVDQLSKSWGLAKSCMTSQWQGGFKAWSNGDGVLHVDEAKWKSGDSKVLSDLNWSSDESSSDRALIKGVWAPENACLGSHVASCWKSAGPSLGAFVLSGGWDKLKFQWQTSSWDMLKNCLSTQPSEQTIQEGSDVDDVKQQMQLKKYLQKNAN